MTDCNSASMSDNSKIEKLQDSHFTSLSPNSIDRKLVQEVKAIEANNYDKFQNETLKNKEQNRLLRKEFAYKAYKIAVGCLVFWAIVVAVNMGSKWCRGDALFSDTALGIITTGTTVNVFAALLTVIKGLFTKIDE